MTVRRRRWLIAAAFFVAVAAQVAGRVGPKPVAPAVRPDPTRGLAVVLDGAALTITLVNRGTEPLTLIEPSDNCAGPAELEWAGVERRRPRPGYCGNADPIRPADVFTLGPGESRQLAGRFATPHFATPGVHHVVVQYSLDPGRLPRSSHDPDIVDRLRRTGCLSVLSNVAEVVVPE